MVKQSLYIPQNNQDPSLLLEKEVKKGLNMIQMAYFYSYPFGTNRSRFICILNKVIR